MVLIILLIDNNTYKKRVKKNLVTISSLSHVRFVSICFREQIVW